MEVPRRRRSGWPRGARAALAALVLFAPAQAREPGEARHERTPAAREAFVAPAPLPLPDPGPPLQIPGDGDASRRPSHTARSRYILESGPVTFGSLEPGVASEIPAAIRVRVFSQSDWTLSFVPTSSLRVVEGGESVPLTRLAWRSPISGGFVPVREDGPFTIARGAPTGGAGFLVIVDARLSLAAEDPTGHYACSFRLLLEEL